LSAKLDAIIKQGIAKRKFPGAVLIVGRIPQGSVRNAVIVKREVYGARQWLPEEKPMLLDTIFDLASVSKVVGTATAAMLLIQDGKLSLDDKVSKYLPEFAQNGKEAATIRNLMTHTSGLKPYTTVDAIRKDFPNDPPYDALIRHICKLPARQPPGTKVVYSCLNYLTLARINEIVAGETQNSLLQQRVYRPLGMKDTTYVLTDEQKARCAPTTKVGDKFLQGEVHDPLAHFYGWTEHTPGNAGLFSTADDLAKYAEMILNDGTYRGKKVFEPATIELMTSRQTPPNIKSLRGLGWGIYSQPPYCTNLNKTPENFCLGHTGYTGTYIWLDKYSKTFIVFLTNRVHPDDKTSVDEYRKNVVKAVLASLDVY
jgi:CubicO group peptidase (beta-lactamase class C family)